MWCLYSKDCTLLSKIVDEINKVDGTKPICFLAGLVKKNRLHSNCDLNIIGVYYTKIIYKYVNNKYISYILIQPSPPPLSYIILTLVPISTHYLSIYLTVFEVMQCDKHHTSQSLTLGVRLFVLCSSECRKQYMCTCSSLSCFTFLLKYNCIMLLGAFMVLFFYTRSK